MLLLSPVDLFGVERVAHTKRDRNAARARTDHRNFRQLARDVLLKSKLAAQRDGQHARRVVVAESEWHLKIMWRVLSVRVNEVALTKRSGALQNLHYSILGRNQLDHARFSCFFA